MKIIRDAQLTLPSANIRNVEDLINLLTVKNPEYDNRAAFSQFGARDTPKELQFFSIDTVHKTVTVPRNIAHKYYQQTGNYEDYTTLGKPLPPIVSDLIVPRDYQEEYLKENGHKISTETDQLHVMPCGHGKTVMGLLFVKNVGKNTLVVVTTYQLAKQWRNRIKEFLPELSVGIYDDEKKTQPEYDITITTYALMGKERFGRLFYAKYGHIILDEVHRVGAPTYHSILSKAPCRYRTSLTATFRRKDKMEDVLIHHCGTKMVMENQFPPAVVIPLKTGWKINVGQFTKAQKFPTKFDNLPFYTTVEVLVSKGNRKRGILIQTPDPRVIQFQGDDGTTLEITEGSHKVYRMGNVVMADVDTAQSEDAERNEKLSYLIHKCLKGGRTILVLGKRKQFLYDMAAKFSAEGVKCGVVASTKSKEQKEYCKSQGFDDPEEYEDYCLSNCNLIFGIDKLAKEGLDADRLDTLIYTYAEKDVEQGVGRIQRLKEGKKQAYCFYLVDDVPMYHKAFYDKGGAREMFIELGHIIYKELTWQQL